MTGRIFTRTLGKINPESAAKVLWLLSQGPLRGSELKALLVDYFNMSNETYNNARHELHETGSIERIKVKPQGKHYLYKITAKGEELFNAYGKSFLNSISIKRKFPLVLSQKIKGKRGEVELQFFSALGGSTQALEELDFLAGRPPLHNLIWIMLDKHNRNVSLDTQKSLDVNVELRIKTRGKVSQKIFSFQKLVQDLETLEARWRIERNLLFELYRNQMLTDKRISEHLCSVDYFSSRPEALVECHFITRGIQDRVPKYIYLHLNKPQSLHLFASLKWPLLDGKIKQKVLEHWKRWLNEMNFHGYFSSDPIQAYAFDLDYPLVLYEYYPHYQPDYKIIINKKEYDFSTQKDLLVYRKYVKSADVKNWLKYVNDARRDLYHLRPWEVLLGELQNGKNTIRPFPPHDTNIIESRTQDTSSLLYLIHKLDALVKGEEKLKNSAELDLLIRTPSKAVLESLREHKDYEYFEAWSFIQDSLKENGVPLFWRPIQKLYERWNLSGRPPMSTNYVGRIILVGIEALTSASKVNDETNEIMNKALKAMHEMADRINI